MLEHKDNPTEADFPLIDRCVICEEICDWQPRYEIATRTAEHKALLASKRPLGYTPEHRVVKFCAGCLKNFETNEQLRVAIRQNYPVYAREKGI